MGSEDSAKRHIPLLAIESYVLEIGCITHGNLDFYVFPACVYICLGNLQKHQDNRKNKFRVVLCGISRALDRQFYPMFNHLFYSSIVKVAMTRLTPQARSRHLLYS